MKRTFARMAAALLAAVLFFSVKVDALSAEKLIVIDATTGRALYEKNADDRALIASTTKIMTALVVCEQCNVLDRMCIPKEAIGIEGSSMYLQTGEVLTIQELLYGLMLHSGNDAAVALAIYCGGTVEGFAELMNDKARQLGMYNTHFSNPHGLDAPDHFSTARDMAVLTAYAMKNPIFAKTVSTKSITIGNRTLRNHNKLLWRVDGADGVKTGYTKKAGRILVSSATRQNRQIVVVTINAPNDWNDHAQLFEQGFSKYKIMHIVSKGDVLGTKMVIGGDDNLVELIADENFDYPLSPDENASLVIQQPDFVYAPVVEGQTAGYAYVCIDGEVIGKILMVYGQTIEQVKPEKNVRWDRLFGGN